MTRRFRPLALGFWSLIAVAATSGAPAAVCLTCAVPLGAVLLGGSVAGLWMWTADVRRSRRITYNASRGVSIVDGLAPAALGALVLAGATAGPMWVDAHVSAASAEDGAPLRASVAWLDANSPDDRRLLVDDRLWLDAVTAGADPATVAVPERLADSVLSYDYAVV